MPDDYADLREALKRSPAMTDEDKQILKRTKQARNFPFNTCPASRHAQLAAESLMRRRVYSQFFDEPVHIGASIMSTVGRLYEARTRIAELEADARRYRWLCEFREWPEPVEAAIDCGHKVLIDEAVDAWIKEKDKPA
jgi:hypothetical protein